MLKHRKSVYFGMVKYRKSVILVFFIGFSKVVIVKYIVVGTMVQLNI